MRDYIIKLFFAVIILILGACGEVNQSNELVAYKEDIQSLYKKLDDIYDLINEGEIEKSSILIFKTGPIVEEINDDNATIKHYLNKTALSYVLSNENEIKDNLYFLDLIIDKSTIKDDRLKFINAKGLYYYLIENYKMAIVYFDKSRKNSVEKEALKDASSYYFNVICSYVKLSDWESIIKYGPEAILLAKTNNLNEQECLLNYYLGMAYCESNKYKESIKYFFLSRDVAKKIPNNLNKIKILPHQSQYLYGLAVAYEEMKNYKLSTKYFSEYSNKLLIFQSIRSNLLNQNISISKRMEIQNAENKALKLKATVQEHNIIFTGIMTISLLILCFLLFSNLNLKEKTNEILTQKNQEISVQKERAEEAFRLKTKFVNQVTHELRTPLHAINGIAYVLSKEGGFNKQEKNIDALKFSGRYLLGFINDIIDLNAIDGELAINLNNDAFEIHRLLGNISESMKYLLLENNNQLEIKIDSFIPHLLIGDRRRLSQIIINNLTNSFQNSKDSKIILGADLKSTRKSSIFVSFYIKQKTNQANFRNIKKFIDLMNEDDSTIYKILEKDKDGFSFAPIFSNKLLHIFDSKMKFHFEKENTYVLSFDIEFDVIEDQKDNETEINHGDYNLKILLVEDNKINQMVTKKILNMNGHTCQIASDGFRAIDYVMEEDYDLILMDIMMPGIDGFETSKRIREINKSTPIIALTALSENRNSDHFKGSGIQNIINKPFNPKTFFEKIYSEMRLSLDEKKSLDRYF